MIFFEKYPKVLYTFDNFASVIQSTNLLTRFKFNSSIKNNPLIYYEYFIQDMDTPENISAKIYGTPHKHWIIMLMNDIYDYQYDWVMSYTDFTQYVDNKYMEFAPINKKGEGLSWAKSSIKSYYKIESTRLSNGKIKEREYEITKEEYEELPDKQMREITLQDGTKVQFSTTKKYITYFAYEQNKNEQRRTIKLVKPEFVSVLESEVSALL